ncbi:MAG: hypothetical protein U0798_16905 [Gemmataceae bacterium]
MLLFCRHGTSVSLVILPPRAGPSLAEIPLDSHMNRTGDHWHIRVRSTCRTNFATVGRGWPERPPAYDPTRILLDPAATIFFPTEAHWAATCERDPERTSRRSLFARSPAYD